MADLVKSKVRFSSFTTSDETQISLSEEDVLIVVGPNNAGKSQLLRDLQAHFALTVNGVYSGLVVKTVSVAHDPPEQIMREFEKFRENGTEYFSTYGVKVHQNYVTNALQSGATDLKFGGIENFFVKRISVDDRLSIVFPSPAIIEQIETPGQLLYDNEVLLTQVSTLFREAFNRDLFLDYRSGGLLPLYVGDKPEVPSGMDRVSDGYVRLVRACDKLHEQGDGMKGFGGILLSTLVVHYNITLIDEPEAFLHPPQERVIGRIIGKNLNGQVICSTHSKNVLQGFLESDRQNIRVMRITRNQSKNKVSEISPAEVRKLWKDPVFRYSTALDALFHDQAILCEADPDCRFFEALQGEIGGAYQRDVHYIPCGGKAAFPKFIKALRKLSIPTLAILDLDALNDEATIKKIFEAQGGDWSEVKELWNKLNMAVRDGVPPATIDETKAAIADLFDNWLNGPPPQSDIVELLKRTKPWGKVKEMGLVAVPSGDAQKTANELLEVLARRSIFLIPVGTLEKFVPTVGNHGTKWLSEVFRRHSMDSKELTTAREFMSKVLADY